jgi:hypothetical protein
MVLDLLAEPVCKPCDPAHGHSHGQVLPFHETYAWSSAIDGNDKRRVYAVLGKAASPDEGYERDEATRCLGAIGAFKTTFAQVKPGKITFQPGPSNVAMNVETVTINSRLDPPLTEQGRDGITRSRGLVLLLASSPDARRDIATRTKTVATIIHWALENAASNVHPHPRLCMSFDAFGQQVVRAPDSYANLRRRISASCREAVGSWDRVEPAAGYDGPDWRSD